MDIVIRRYSTALSADWASVISRAKNAVFLFERNFIEYHENRFVEMSAIAYVADKPVALMPGAFDEASGEVVSHPGLTFGGVVLTRELRGEVAIAVIEAILGALGDWGAKSCTIKLLPHAFANYPSAELDYVLWRRGFSLTRRDLSSILPLQDSIPFNTLKNRAVKKAIKAGLSVSEVAIDDFHWLLACVLQEQHGVAPVHTKEELEELQMHFPGKIFTRAAMQSNTLLAGALVFNYDNVWHTQYLASSLEGRSLGALDLVISEIKNQALASGASYLSFGVSTESAGQVLNEGLLWQKESYGARSITHDFMKGDIS